jgi:hypothetical protein
MLQVPAEAKNKRRPKERKTALNTRIGTGILKTLWWGLDGSTRMVKFFFACMAPSSLEVNSIYSHVSFFRHL